MSRFCVIAGTKITLNGGKSLPIEQIKAGEEVLSFDLNTLQRSQKYDVLVKLKTNNFSGIIKKDYVKNIWKNTADEYFAINDRLKITGDHIVLAKRDDTYYWTKVFDLKIGDYLFTEFNIFEKIETIILIRERVKVFNLEVNSIYNYFANSYLIHNGAPCSACAACGAQGQITGLVSIWYFNRGAFHNHRVGAYPYHSYSSNTTFSGSLNLTSSPLSVTPSTIMAQPPSLASWAANHYIMGDALTGSGTGRTFKALAQKESTTSLTTIGGLHDTHAGKYAVFLPGSGSTEAQPLYKNTWYYMRSNGSTTHNSWGYANTRGIFNSAAKRAKFKYWHNNSVVDIPSAQDATFNGGQGRGTPYGLDALIKFIGDESDFNTADQNEAAGLPATTGILRQVGTTNNATFYHAHSPETVLTSGSGAEVYVTTNHTSSYMVHYHDDPYGSVGSCSDGQGIRIHSYVLNHVTSADIKNGGSGYSVGDVLTIEGLYNGSRGYCPGCYDEEEDHNSYNVSSSACGGTTGSPSPDGDPLCCRASAYLGANVNDGYYIEANRTHRRALVKVTEVS